MGARHPARTEWEFVFVPNNDQTPLLECPDSSTCGVFESAVSVL